MKYLEMKKRAILGQGRRVRGYTRTAAGVDSVTAEGAYPDPARISVTGGHVEGDVNPISTKASSIEIAQPWYAPRHAYDHSPDSTSVVSMCPYDEDEGFLSGFDDTFLVAVLDTDLTVALPAADGGGSETITRRFFLPSRAEVCGSDENGVTEGSLLSLFSANTNASRVAYVSQYAAADREAKGGSAVTAGDAGTYWFRTPLSSTPAKAYSVYADGSMNANSTNGGDRGVRPLCNVASSYSVDGTTVGSMDVGDRITVRHAVLGDIPFLVADRNHAGYPSGSTTLIAEKILLFRAFDAQEPDNSVADRRSYGNNRYSVSNIDGWLNSTAGKKTLWKADTKGTWSIDRKPYLRRPTGGDADTCRVHEIVGATVVFNQLVNAGTQTVSTISGRKYYTKIGGVESIVSSSGSAIAVSDDAVDIVADLTSMFGADIADYVYSLGSSNGVSWLKSVGFFENRPAYDAGTLLSVKTSGKKVTGATPAETATYPVDGIELRGLLKLDANNNLYADGDTYASDGTVTRKYGTRNLGSFTLNSSSGTYPTRSFFVYFGAAKVGGQFIYNGNTVLDENYTGGALQIYRSGNQTLLGIRCLSTYASQADAKTALSAVDLVYERAAQTTETAAPFAERQSVSEYGTEEWLDGRAVPMPVGHKTEYLPSYEPLDSVTIDATAYDGKNVVRAVTKPTVGNMCAVPGSSDPAEVYYLETENGVCVIGDFMLENSTASFYVYPEERRVVKYDEMTGVSTDISRAPYVSWQTDAPAGATPVTNATAGTYVTRRGVPPSSVSVTYRSRDPQQGD